MRWIAFLFVIFANPALALPAQDLLPVGARAPSFVRPALNGQPIALSAYRGKVVLLDFWASWCGPCIVEMPDLIALQKHYAGKLQIIGVSMDDSDDSARDVARRFPFNYPLTMGDAKFAERYGGILGLPSLFLVGRDGEIVQKWRGELKSGELEEAVQTAVR